MADWHSQHPTKHTGIVHSQIVGGKECSGESQTMRVRVCARYVASHEDGVQEWTCQLGMTHTYKELVVGGLRAATLRPSTVLEWSTLLHIHAYVPPAYMQPRPQWRAID